MIFNFKHRRYLLLLAGLFGTLFSGLPAQNVGIGVASPAVKLHVSAWIRSDSLAGPDSALVIADQLGTLRRFEFNGNGNTVLGGNATWVTLPAGGGGTYGDFSYPDGFDGISPLTRNGLSTTPYVVPAGKNLYVSQVYSGSANYVFQVNGLTVYRGFSAFGSSGRIEHLDQPIILAPGDQLGATDNGLTANGFLIDSTVAPMTMNNLSASPYVVPAGKVFVILNYYALNSSASLNVDGVRVYYGYSNWGDSTNDYNSLGDVMFVGPGQTLSANANDVVVNGYLRDP